MPHTWSDDDVWLRDWLKATAAHKDAGFVIVKGQSKWLSVNEAAAKLLANIEGSVPFETSDAIIRAMKFWATMTGRNPETPIKSWTLYPSEAELIDEAVSPVPMPINWKNDVPQYRRRTA